ncbi:MAG TPA: aspartate kinase [Cryomorphaceae bacterium]|nr:aspartate kinase [Cryomorphaceae bacterium]|tara:strand:- start:2128 stop:3387 length:1260 start_codon:yes stop_codon:yes gene_type:complete
MSTPLVFKFGGASIKNAQSMHNVASIIGRFNHRPMVVVVSAIGKMTNAFEEIVSKWSSGKFEEANTKIDAIATFHQQIINELFADPTEINEQVAAIISSIQAGLSRQDMTYSEGYDYIVHHGELISSRIIAAYVGIEEPTVWHDTRDLVKTDGQFRRATVQWDETSRAIRSNIVPDKINIVQGFIGSCPDGRPTTLGREGSDYTGAVFAFCLGADSLTIWKDVPGMLNGDPKTFANTQKIDALPYNEAIELAFYGASIIHPKTIQPLKKKGIPLHIKSFKDPSLPGTTIGDIDQPEPTVANFILKKNQILIQLSTKDLAFIAEHHLSAVYNLFAEQGVVVNLMRNTATRAMFCIDNDAIIVPKVLPKLTRQFDIELTSSVELLTIRHTNEEDEIRETGGLDILLEQRTPYTVQFVFKRF